LIGAVLGQRILSVFAQLTNEVKLFTPETSFNDALEHLPKILRSGGEQQGLSNERIEEGIETALERLNSLQIPTKESQRDSSVG
jgi:hypothetical protein